MKVLHDFAGFDASAGSAVAVGVFDGLHLGHASVVSVLRESAARLSVPACVVTFRTHPRGLSTGLPQPLVASVEHRLLLLERGGVDVCLSVDFTRELASLPAEAFVKYILRGKLGARALVLGHDARFGRGRDADAERIREIAEGEGIETRVVPPVVVDGEPVSSTRVREAIGRGDLDAAARMLGRRVSVLGRAVPGRGRGRLLGFPTANLDLQHEVRPPHGVYATWACVGPCEPDGGERFQSVSNSGFRPTFVERGEPEGTTERLIEVHLLDYDRAAPSGPPSPPFEPADEPAGGRRTAGAELGHDRAAPSDPASRPSVASGETHPAPAGGHTSSEQAGGSGSGHTVAPELYGRAIEVEFVRKLREERRFESDKALARQIERDIEAARAILGREYTGGVAPRSRLGRDRD